MAEPIFEQLFQSALYTLQAGPAPGPGWVGFIWQGGGTPGPQYGLAASFPNGHYLFAPTAPALTSNEAAVAYADAIVAWLTANFGGPSQFTGNACVWLPDGEGPVFGAPGSSALTFSANAGGGVSTGAGIPADFNLGIGQLTFSVPAQTTMGMGARGLTFGIAGTGQVQFSISVGTPPSVVGGGALPLVGPFAGAFTIAGAISGAGPGNTIDALRTGFHFLYGPTLVRQVHALIDTAVAPAQLNYVASVDPLDLFNGGAPLSAPEHGRLRTQFCLAGPGSASPIPSWWRTAVGAPIDMLPLAALDENGEPQPWSAGMAPQVETDAAQPPASVYLTPVGDFALAATGAAKAGDMIELLPGPYGSERIALRSWQADGPFDRLRFEPGRPAYAAAFPFTPADLSDPQPSDPLTRLAPAYRTAWGAVVGGTGAAAASYAAQPNGSPLYAPTAGAGDTAVPVLPPLPTPSPIAPVPMPLAPYAGLTVQATGAAAAAADVGGFESEVLSPVRKAILGAPAIARVAALRSSRGSRLRAAEPAQAVQQTTTPQGLYAELELPTPSSPETLYERVVVARSLGQAGTIDFGFEVLAPELQDLFQTNQLMAVIVDPAKLGAPAPADPAPPAGTPVFNRQVVMSGWEMTAAVGESAGGSAYGNILILKYCDGSLADRVASPEKWTATGTFTAGTGDPAFGLTALSAYLRSYLADGIAAGATNSLYGDFAKIVTDPNWQGFIVLGAKVDPASFPDQIRGLVAGIDFTRFDAHHFGATASRVTVSGSTVTMEVPSSLFGLIDYQLPAYRNNVVMGGNPDMPLPLSTDGDFGFCVLQLQVLFRNAAIADFRSRVQLTVNRLFLSPVTSAYGSGIGRLPAQGVVLRGSYSRQGSTGVYVFEQDSTTRFLLSGSVLPSVALERVVFNTLASGETDGIVRSRFLMSGALEFVTLTVPDASKKAPPAAADLLSFGPPPGAPPTDPADGLAFSGVEVALSSELATPNAVTFAFEAAKLALDAGASVPRVGSLYRDLALQVDGFVVGPADKRPINFGYLPVTVEPPVEALSGPWFGISYTVTMGSPGALVAKAGFSSRLLLAWAPTSQPGDAQWPVFVGLQLPGAAPGAKLVSLQGVLKLSIDSLLLRREAVSGPMPSFTLRLNDIGLSFLGLAKLPSGGGINFFLFGDPSGAGSLGWYSAYAQTPPPPAPPAPPPPLLPAPHAPLSRPQDGSRP